MAVLLISYKYNPETSKADYDGFYEVIRSYRWAKLSASNYAINADESAKAVWQKLKAYIDPDDYLVMLTFKSSPWDLQIRKFLLGYWNGLEDPALVLSAQDSPNWAARRRTGSIVSCQLRTKCPEFCIRSNRGRSFDSSDLAAK